MSAPRLEINLEKIFHNASTLVARLKLKGISVTGVTKSFLGDPQIAREMLRAGATSLGDSRIENIELMRQSGIDAPMMLIRSPMVSQAARVVASADISLNTEIEAVRALSHAAQKTGKPHGVVLMVELGDLREGIMPQDIEHATQTVAEMPYIKFMGLGTNLACRNGVVPDDRNMAELSALTDRFVGAISAKALLISGGNSSNLKWAFNGGKIGHINNLRLGEAIVLGRDPLSRQPIEGLSTSAISLAVEVIESKLKPSKSWGTLAQSAFNRSTSGENNGEVQQAIVAIGRQDIDPEGVYPSDDIEVLDASSDHLVLGDKNHCLSVGSEVQFQLNYSAFLRAMTSPHISKIFIARNAFKHSRLQIQTLPDAA